MIQYHKPPFLLRDFKIEVTYRCDLNCIHCSSDARPSNPLEMSRDDCLRILSEAAQMGAREVAFSGGEPLGWAHILDAAETAASVGLAVTIYTSGNVVDFADKATRLRRLGVSGFVFSLFGGTIDSHERTTRTRGSFERTKTAIKVAREIGIETELHFVPMANNYRELSDIVALGRELGASEVSVLRLVPQGRAALLPGRALNRVQNLELRRQIRDLIKSGFDIRTGSPYNFLLLNDEPGCCAAIDRLIIGPNLRVYPCDAFKQVGAEELVGTLDRSSLHRASLQECWDQSPFLDAVRKHLMTPFEDPCESCGLLDKCLSGCLAQKVVAYKTLEKHPDPDCLGPNFRGDAT